MSRQWTEPVILCLSLALTFATRVHAASFTVDYTYDNADRVTRADYSGGAYVTLGYDNSGTRTSRSASVPPTITIHPASQTKDPGDAVTFEVVATGSPTLIYQWKKGTDAINGATGSTYTINSVQEGDEGAYSCTVANSFGNDVSTAVDLTVNAPADVALDAGADGGDGTPDAFSVKLNGNLLEVYRDTGSGSVLFYSKHASAVNKLTINGSSDDDTLTVDFSGGDPFPANGITFNGDGQANGDGLTFTGGTFDTVTYLADGTESGSVGFDGGTVTYTGLEPITDNTNASHRVFTINYSGQQLIRLTDDGDPNNGMTRIDSDGEGHFEQITFSNPTASLTINAGDDDDTIVVASLDVGFAVGITVDGQADSDTLRGPTFTNTWAITSDDGGTLDVDGWSVTVTFTAVESLDGSTANDIFRFHTAGVSLSGSVAGHGGTDTLDHTGYGMTDVQVQGSNAEGDYGTEVNSLGAGFSGIDDFASGGGPVVPALSEWGAVLLALALAFCVLLRTRRPTTA